MTTDGGGYKLTAFFSTDGKHTIQVECDKGMDNEGKKDAIAKGMNLYDFVVERLGTKAQMWEKNMNGKKKPPAKEEKVDREECDVDHDNLRPLQVKKDGKNKGRWFRSCQNCNYFEWIK